MSSAKWRPFCLGLNVLRIFPTIDIPNINPLHAKFFMGNKNVYLPFTSFLHIDMTQVVEIFPQVSQELTYFI